MSLRQWPFKRTCYNLYFNVRNYRPTKQRPTFLANNHPFCTNIQLLDASYTNWFIRTSKTLPSKLFNITKDESFRKKPNCALKNAIPTSASPLPNLTYIQPDIAPSDDQKIHLIRQVSHHIHEGDLVSLHKKLVNNSSQVDSNILLYILDQSLRDIPPPPQQYGLGCDIEPPLYKASNYLNTHNTYYEYIHSRIPHLYRICKQFEHTVSKNNQHFQQHYIWLCYHTNDMAKLESLVHYYLQNSSYNRHTLGYIFSGFILNYEVEFAKTLFQSLLSLGRELHVSLLETIICQLVQVDALFENMVSIFQSWITLENAVVSPKAVATLLKQHYRFASAQELASFQKLIKSYGLDKHHLVQTVELQCSILHRDPGGGQKKISPQDLVRLEDIASTITSIPALESFYLQMLQFFVQYSNIKMVQYVLMNIKHHNIELTDEHFNLIAEYYARHGKFITLVKYLKSSSSQIQFSEHWLAKVFEAFVRAYPYQAYEFSYNFHIWIKNHSKFTQETKDRLLSNLRITKLNSKLTPYHLDRNVLELKKQKYDSSYWKIIDWKKDKNGRMLRFGDQVQYRINKGFVDVLRKGVRPDVQLMLNTFKRSDLSNKHALIDLMKKTRTYQPLQIELDLIMLQARNTKESLVHYYDQLDQSRLDCNARIKFARMLMNKNLFRQSKQILAGIDKDDLDDKARMIKLNIELRNATIGSDFVGIVGAIEQFPIDETVLSPYIYNQCCYIEKNLMAKLRYFDKKASSPRPTPAHFEASRPALLQALESVRGLIADISLRLEKDGPQLSTSVSQLFTFLDSWMDRSH